jgi:hypothetical protein
VGTTLPVPVHLALPRPLGTSTSLETSPVSCGCSARHLHPTWPTSTKLNHIHEQLHALGCRYVKCAWYLDAHVCVWVVISQSSSIKLERTTHQGSRTWQTRKASSKKRATAKRLPCQINAGTARVGKVSVWAVLNKKCVTYSHNQELPTWHSPSRISLPSQ